MYQHLKFHLAVLYSVLVNNTLQASSAVQVIELSDDPMSEESAPQERYIRFKCS